MRVTEGAAKTFEQDDRGRERPALMRQRYRVAAIAVAFLFLAAMGVASLRHNALLIDAPIASGSVEWDFYYGYVRDAMRIASLEAPRDEFRGPLYPLLLALLHWIFPFASYFVIAKVVTLVSAAGALMAVFLIGEEMLGPLYGLAAMAATACVATFGLLSLLAGTDMFFASLSLLALYFLVLALRRTVHVAPLVAAGAFCGLAMTTRWNAVFLPAGAVLALALALDVPVRERVRRIAMLAVSFAVAMLPWLSLNAFLHGSPLYNRNYLNARLAIFDGNAPWFDSMSATIAYDPAHFFLRWGHNIIANIGAVGRQIAPLLVFVIAGFALILLRGRQRPRVLALVACCAALFALNALGPYVARQYLVAIAIFALAGAVSLEWLASLDRIRKFALPAGLVAWCIVCTILLTASVANLNLVAAAERTLVQASRGAAAKSVAPLVGDWDGDGIDDVGVSRDGNGYTVFYLIPALVEGPARWIAAFGPQKVIPIAGDWDGDGKASIGVFAAGSFFLGNHNASGHAEITSTFGDKDGVPVIGDWNGDGRDSLGSFKDGIFTLTDQIAPPFTTRTFTFGGPGDYPIAGDWDGDGKDTVGVFRDGVFTLTNRTGPPFDDTWKVYAAISGGVPLAGRRNGDRRDSPMFYAGGTFYFFDGHMPDRRRIDLNGLADLPVAGE
jgi:hypothetical protein